MLIFRAIAMLLLVGVIASMVFYVATGNERYKWIGLKLIKWGVLASLGFFGVLLLERVL